MEPFHGVLAHVNTHLALQLFALLVLVVLDCGGCTRPDHERRLLFSGRVDVDLYAVCRSVLYERGDIEVELLEKTGQFFVDWFTVLLLEVVDLLFHEFEFGFDSSVFVLELGELGVLSIRT